MISGFLNINKPDNITSFKCVSKIKTLFHIDKIGHLGTLDPAGTGVLPLAVGKATKLIKLFENYKKTYRAIFVFGKETDTLDSEGIVTNENNMQVTKEDVEKIIPKFIGKQMQMPPKYSAKKVNGVRAYNLAREGKDIQLNPKNIEIFNIKLVEEVKKNTFLFEIECSTGTYIRSLCRDIAYELKTVAYMPLIIRTQVGCFTIDNSEPLNYIVENKNIEECLISYDKVLNYEKLSLDELSFNKVRNGVSIEYKAVNGKYFLTYKDVIFAVGNITNNNLKMEICLE